MPCAGAFPDTPNQTRTFPTGRRRVCNKLTVKYSMPGTRKIIFALWLAAFAVNAHCADTKKPDSAIGQVVAVVNDEVITRHELDERFSSAVRTLQKQGTPLPARDALEK